MSRIGKNPINIYPDVKVNIVDKAVEVSGPHGVLSIVLFDGIHVVSKDNVINVSCTNKDSNAMWGTTRALINNMVNGVHNQFTKVMILKGVGFRASVNGDILTLKLGYSHDIEYKIRNGVSIECPNNTTLSIKGIDKYLVSQSAAEIRALRKIDYYRGKGILYEGEVLVLKEGKKKKK